MSKPLKLVIFDCDGTLVDGQHMIVASMTQAYAAHGIAVPKPRNDALDGRPVADRDVHRTGKRRRTIPGCKSRRTLQDCIPRAAPQRPAHRAALSGRRGSRGRRWAAARGRRARPSRPASRRRGRASRARPSRPCSSTSSRSRPPTMRPSKPDPGMVLDAMREAGAAAENTVVVGDTVYDVAMARAPQARLRSVCCMGLPFTRGARRGRRSGDRHLRRARADARQNVDTCDARPSPHSGTVPPSAVQSLKFSSCEWHGIFCRSSGRTRKISSRLAGISAGREPADGNCQGIAKEFCDVFGHIPAMRGAQGYPGFFGEWLATNFPPNAALFGTFSGVLRTHASRWSNWGAIHVAKHDTSWSSMTIPG